MATDRTPDLSIVTMAFTHGAAEHRHRGRPICPRHYLPIRAEFGLAQLPIATFTDPKPTLLGWNAEALNVPVRAAGPDARRNRACSACSPTLRRHAHHVHDAWQFGAESVVMPALHVRSAVQRPQT